jgi:hypothetical protein
MSNFFELKCPSDEPCRITEPTISYVPHTPNNRNGVMAVMRKLMVTKVASGQISNNSRKIQQFY